VKIPVGCVVDRDGSRVAEQVLICADSEGERCSAQAKIGCTIARNVMRRYGLETIQVGIEKTVRPAGRQAAGKGHKNPEHPVQDVPSQAATQRFYVWQ